MIRRYIAQRLRQSAFLRSGQTPWRNQNNIEHAQINEENFARHTFFVLDVGKRVIKVSLIGLLGLGSTAAAIFEGLHQYVEKKELAPETDEEVKRWEWDLETEQWSGDRNKGGTDPKLGFEGRHAARSAWMALNWSVGYSASVLNTDTKDSEGFPGLDGLKIIDARLQRAEDFLKTAIRIAEDRQADPLTVTYLILRHGNVSERLGKDFLPEAKGDYERAWAGLDKKGMDAGRIAATLGNLSMQLGESSEALAWWSKAISIVRGRELNPESLMALPASLDSVPSSPSAQRLFVSILVTLSAFYAQSGQLKQAQAIQEKALDMLRSIPTPPSVASASSSQALHSLFVLQRSSLLSIHLAEVLHAQKQPVATSIQWLTSAAHSSERVTCALTGLPAPTSLPTKENPRPTSSAAPGTPAMASCAQAPLPRFSVSRATNKVAHALLRDARRTSAEAWNLLGMLYETDANKLDVALHCYERAVDWAGTPSDDPDTIKQAAESTLRADWDIYWGNYMRIKRMLDGTK